MGKERGLNSLFRKSDNINSMIDIHKTSTRNNSVLTSEIKRLSKIFPTDELKQFRKRT